MSGFDAVTLVPPNAYLWRPPELLVYCLDCDVALEPWSAWSVAVKVPWPDGGLRWYSTSPLCRRCAVRRDPRLAS